MIGSLEVGKKPDIFDTRRWWSACALRIALAVLVMIVAPSFVLAQQRGGVTVQEYLALNESQQLTQIERMMGETTESCAPEMSAVDLREYFGSWAEDHTGWLSRNVVLAFTAAVLDLCREEPPPEEPTKLKRLEAGDWTALPYLLGQLTVEVFNDYTFESDDPDEEINDLFTETNLTAFALFARQLYIEAKFSFQPTGEPPPGNNTFEDHALRISALALTWDREVFWISAGKGRPLHGIGSQLAFGIWGPDVLSEQFDVTERLGVAGNFTVGSDGTGHHSLYGGVFTADNSFLSRRYLTNGERTSRSDGGPANTGSLDSFVVSVDGQGIPKVEGLRYHVSAMKQAVDRVNDLDGEPLPPDQIDDETRFVAALEWSGIEVGGETALTPLVEYGRLRNARGIKDSTERFLTASLLLTTGRWNLALAGPSWSIERPGIQKLDYDQYQISGGYAFESSITLEAGYRFLDVFGTQSHTFGLAFYYGLPFGL